MGEGGGVNNDSKKAVVFSTVLFCSSAANTVLADDSKTSILFFTSLVHASLSYAARLRLYSKRNMVYGPYVRVDFIVQSGTKTLAGLRMGPQYWGSLGPWIPHS